MDQDVAAALKQRGLDYVGMVYDESVGDMAMHLSLPELSSYSIPRELQDFQPFGHQAGDEECRHLMALKKNGWIYYACEYRYSADMSTNQNDEIYSDVGGTVPMGSFAIVAADVLVDLPLLTVEPQSSITRLAMHMGFHEMKLESNEFDETYRLKCSEERRVSDLLNPRAIGVLLNAPPMTWQMGGRHIVLFKPGNLTLPFAADAIDALLAFTACIPGFVQEDHFASRLQV